MSALIIQINIQNFNSNASITKLSLDILHIYIYIYRYIDRRLMAEVMVYKTIFKNKLLIQYLNNIIKNSYI